MKRNDNNIFCCIPFLNTNGEKRRSFGQTDGAQKDRRSFNRPGQDLPESEPQKNKNAGKDLKRHSSGKSGSFGQTDGAQENRQRCNRPGQDLPESEPQKNKDAWKDLKRHSSGKSGIQEETEDLAFLPNPHEQQSPQHLNTLTDEQSRVREELSILLVGSRGAGKSATGNSLLGRGVFESRPAAGSVTQKCQRGEGNWGGRPLVVVDTPGLLSLTAPSETLLADMERCAELSAPGPHALLLMIQVGRFTAEERAAAQTIQRLFREEVLQFMVIVFTRKEDLDGKTIEMFVEEGDEWLKDLVKSCEGRFCAFNNRETGRKRDKQVRELMQVIDKMMEGNGNRYYRWERCTSSEETASGAAHSNDITSRLH